MPPEELDDLEDDFLEIEEEYPAVSYRDDLVNSYYMQGIL